jgi:hypothetical protein
MENAMTMITRLSPELRRVLGPSEITCPSYEALPGKRRCRDYADDGSCNRSDRRFCIEWLKLHGHRLPGFPGFHAEDYETLLCEEEFDMVGNRLPGTPISRKKASGKPQPAPAPAPPAPACAPADDPVASPTGLRSEDIESFKALGVEVELELPELGELWLVPAYTGKPRREIMPEHAAKIALLVDAFLGASVTEWLPWPADDAGGSMPAADP